jgi:hypothetical protein
LLVGRTRDRQKSGSTTWPQAELSAGGLADGDPKGEARSAE